MDEEDDVTCEQDPDEKPHKLTASERRERLADSGVDTWEDYRGER